MDKVVDPSSECFRKFIPHSFATMCYDTNVYSTMDMAFMITSVIRSNLSDERYADYVRWLKEDYNYIL